MSRQNSLDPVSGAPDLPTTAAGVAVDVAVCFGNSSVRVLAVGVGAGAADGFSCLINSAHPRPAAWGAPWLDDDAANAKPTPRSLRAHLLYLLDERRLAVRSLTLVVSGRVLHAAGAVELSFLLGEAFTGRALLPELRAALPRARPCGIALINDTACSAIQAYLALSRELAEQQQRQQQREPGCGAPALFPALVVDAGTGCSFAYVHLAPHSRVRVVLLEPWVGMPVRLFAEFHAPTQGAATGGAAAVAAAGETMPLWQAVSDEALRAVGAAAFNVRMQHALAAVQQRLAGAAAGPAAAAAAGPLRAVYFTGGNSTVLQRAAVEAAAPGLQVRGLPRAGEPAPSREQARDAYLRAALAVTSIGHLVDIHNVGEELRPGGVMLG